jgi:hypothetical protein
MVTYFFRINPAMAGLITLKTMQAFGKITSPVLIIKLDRETSTGMHLVLTAHDGFLYAVNGLSGRRRMLFSDP